MKKILTFILGLMPLGLLAQLPPTGFEHLDPSAGYAGKAAFRTEFISYDNRKEAEKGDPEGIRYYMSLLPSETRNLPDNTLFSYIADIPYMWLDRDVYLQVSGLDSYYIYIGEDMVAYGEDSRMPMQFLISDYITDGENRISILHAQGIVPRIEENAGTGAEAAPSVFLFSQPKVCIEDFRLRFWPDSTNSYGIFNVRLSLSNSYNSAEKFSVGYDIYDPNGKLQYYDIREVTLDGRGRDTIRFNEYIYHTNENLWSSANPKLYYGMLSVRRDWRYIEYIPFRIGFGKTEFMDGRILRNGKPVDIKPVKYNALSDSPATRRELGQLKSEGYNTLLPDYPHPAWFYDLCDEVGFYVVDNADINPVPSGLGPIPGGELANEPTWLGRFLKRTESMRARSVNRTSIIGWSLGGDSGNGYNLYKTYLDLKTRELFRLVIYNHAGGQWNTDLPPLLP